MLFSYLSYFCLYFLICQMGRLGKKKSIPPPHGILNPSHHMMPRDAFSEAHWKCLSFKKNLQMWNSYVNLFPKLHSEWFKWESFPLALNPMPLTENEFIACALADFPWHTLLCLARTKDTSLRNPPWHTRLPAGLPTILFSHPNTFRETSYLGNAVHARLIGLWTSEFK